MLEQQQHPAATVGHSCFVTYVQPAISAVMRNTTLLVHSHALSLCCFATVGTQYLENLKQQFLQKLEG